MTRWAVVTGAGNGLGAVIARQAVKAGYRLAAWDIDEQSLMSSATEFGDDFLPAVVDVSDEASVAAAVAALPEPPALLVNNAGVVRFGPLLSLSAQDWRRAVDVNLTGTFLFSQAAGRVMIEQRGGKIVNIASVLALTGARPEIMNAIAYNATKGGILSFTRDLACKWAQHGITVNAIAPGWFPSDLSNVVLEQHEAEMIDSIPLRRFGGPDDLKGAVGFLASAASDYVTGQTLVVDGGQSAW